MCVIVLCYFAEVVELWSAAKHTMFGAQHYKVTNSRGGQVESTAGLVAGQDLLHNIRVGQQDL